MGVPVVAILSGTQWFECVGHSTPRILTLLGTVILAACICFGVMFWGSSLAPFVQC
jgi:hypothetical protein